MKKSAVPSLKPKTPVFSKTAPAGAAGILAETPIDRPLIAIALVMLLIFKGALKLDKLFNSSVFMVNFLFWVQFILTN